MNVVKGSGAGWHQTPQIENNSGTSGLHSPSYHGNAGWSKTGTGSIAHEIAAVEYRHRANCFVVGKLLGVDGEVVLYSKVRQADVLHALDAYSVPPEVLTLPEDYGGSRPHYGADWEQKLYVVDIATVRSKGLLKSMNAAIGRRYHVPRKHWRKVALYYRVPFVEREIVIEAEPKAEQLGLALLEVLP